MLARVLSPEGRMTRNAVGTSISVLSFCAGLAWFAGGTAHASPRCPEGTWGSEGTCCDVGTEYVPAKNRCLPVRPERRCVDGHFDDCMTAGRALEQRNESSASYAAELYRYACEEGYAAACRGLASLYQRGLGIARDEARARILYEESCAGGYAPACTTLAKLLLDEGRDGARATELLTLACHRGDFSACDLHGERLSTDPDQMEHGAHYLERACSGGVGSACRKLVQLERAQQSLMPDRERELLERACSARDAAGCTALGDLLRAASDAQALSPQAVKRYRAACEGGHAAGCTRLAELTFAGDGVKRDPARALELFRRACKDGEAVACERVAALRGEPPRVRTTPVRGHAAVQGN